jgi:DNA-binding response OmpR family regulator
MELINNHFELPDLFIIDKQLSGVDGLDICAHLKTRQLTAQVPVIMVSASPSVEALAKKAGADDFLEKPFNRKEILKLVRKHLDKGT